MRLIALVIVFFQICSYSLAAEVVDKIVAVVNNEIIVLSDFNSLYLPFIYQIKDKVLTKEEIIKIKKEVLDRIIEQKLILQEAMNKNIEIGKREIDSAMDNFKNNLGGEENYEEYLKQKNMTTEGIRLKLKENLIIQKFITEQVRKDIKVNYDDIQNYYENNKGIFKDPDEVQISHILIRVSQTVAEKSAKEKADEIIKQLKSGAGFIELAKTYSDDLATKDNGGDLGWCKKGTYDKDFEQTAFSLREGEISNVIRTPAGFHIIKCGSKKEGKLYKLSDIVDTGDRKVELRQLVYQKVMEQKFEEKTLSFVSKLKEKSVIEIKLDDVK